ncbi:U3 small nucleolar RNA-associated protein 7 [Nematocida sp. LUAm3]|nr:U3 small nucleolar RNA-associated protein 7 [Nematocida sp. LUAm3]KAI5174028.1 U3 small nucleolar RNA-associated protein 7 [Nematocida sp. LUAm2]KAI5177229.1 U3 small nucleolar RNA-associated protein 7 [Nematocida sp. LUAm1]
MSLKKQQQYIEKRKEIKKEYESTIEKYNILNTGNEGELNAPEDSEYVETEEIEGHIDMETRKKAFRLALDNGPYMVRYTPNGRGAMYLSANEVKTMDTVTFSPMGEIDFPTDRIYDGAFLHDEAYFALAQEKNVYIYDRTGVELHVLREHRGAKKLTFLQDHFLLASLSHVGILRYQDTTIGKMISEIFTKERGTCLEHDRTNGVVYVSGASGHVSLWSPRTTEYLAKILCHRSRIRHMKVSENGETFYTSAGNEISTWDMRNTFTPLSTFTVPGQVLSLDVSQRDTIGISQRDSVVVYTEEGKEILKHRTGKSRSSSIKFMPYEDILTIGSSSGIENIVVPGSGALHYRPNENPRITKKARKEIEVRRILEKIPADMISLNSEIGKEMKNHFEEEIVPMKHETSAGKVRRLMRMHYN